MYTHWRSFVAFIISYLMASDEVLNSYEKYEITASTSKKVGMGLITFYFISSLVQLAQYSMLNYQKYFLNNGKQKKRITRNKCRINGRYCLFATYLFLGNYNYGSGYWYCSVKLPPMPEEELQEDDSQKFMQKIFMLYLLILIINF